MTRQHSVLSLAVVAVLSACSSNNGSTGSNSADNGTVGGSTGASTLPSGGASLGGGVATTSTASRGGSTGTGGAGPAGGTTGALGGGGVGGTLAPTGGGYNTSGGVTGGATTAAGAGAKVGGQSAGGTGASNSTGGVTTTKAGATNGGTSVGGAGAIGGATSSASGGGGGADARGGGSGNGGTSSAAAGAKCSGPIGNFSGELATGIDFIDTDGKPVNAHGGGIIKEGNTFYMHGEYFLSTTTDNNFNGFSMYSSQDMATWKNEGLILPQQASGELGPNRKGERPHIIKCPATGEFVLYAHAADVTYQADKEVVYATSATVNGKYSFKGPLTNSSGTTAAHSDMGAFVDGSNAYVITESGHIYTLSTDCHSWLSDKSYSAVNGDSGGVESPVVFKAGSTYYWIGSYKTGWRANNNFYSTASAMTGPWTYQGYIAPVTDPANNLSDERTWLSQSTWVQPVEGCEGTTYVYWGDHWDGNLNTTAPGKHNNLATYVFQPLVFNGTKISMPTYLATWKLDVGKGTWTR